MNARHAFRYSPQLLAAMLVVSVPGEAENPRISPDMVPFPNPTGFAATFSTTGSIDFGSPFFQSLGTNGRSCGTCHQPSDGWLCECQRAVVVPPAAAIDQPQVPEHGDGGRA